MFIVTSDRSDPRSVGAQRSIAISQEFTPTELQMICVEVL